jgi:hypothetical protein
VFFVRRFIQPITHHRKIIIVSFIKTFLLQRSSKDCSKVLINGFVAVTASIGLHFRMSLSFSESAKFGHHFLFEVQIPPMN